MLLKNKNNNKTVDTSQNDHDNRTVIVLRL
jgi:hypothetical protein